MVSRFTLGVVAGEECVSKTQSCDTIYLTLTKGSRTHQGEANAEVRDARLPLRWTRGIIIYAPVGLDVLSHQRNRTCPSLRITIISLSAADDHEWRGGIIGYCFVFVSFPPIYSSLDSLSFGCIFWGGVRTISALRIFAGEHTSSHRRRARAVGDTAIVMRYHDA